GLGRKNTCRFLPALRPRMRLLLMFAWLVGANACSDFRASDGRTPGSSNAAPISDASPPDGAADAAAPDAVSSEASAVQNARPGLDPGFGLAGIAGGYGALANAGALQPDGKILM